jgi:hypothetical protein
MIFAVGATLAPGHRTSDRGSSAGPLVFFAIAMALMIGLRYEVGADWDAYQEIFNFAGRARFERTLKFGDPAYQLLNWSISQLRGEVWQVNLICSMIFCWGLLRLARQQPEPWLAMVIAIPYLVVVVAMGYTRQAVAIGLLMAGLAAVQRGDSTLRFAGYVAVAALFHKTAVVALPLVIFAGRRNFILNMIVGVSLMFLFYNLFLERSVGLLARNYLGSSYSSQGATIRITLNLVPAILFLIKQRAFGFEQRERRIWRYFSYAACVFPIALVLSPSSTAVDRLALYIMPLQVVILSRIPQAFRLPNLGRVMVVAYSALILFIWLTYAKHAEYWLPYQIYPLS